MISVPKWLNRRERRAKRTLRRLTRRKSTVANTQKAVWIPENLHGMLKLHASRKGLYLVELAETFLRDGLMRAEGWERPEDSGAESRKARQIIEDNTSMRLCEKVLEAGCPPEELSISADIHPNFREWAEERGIRCAFLAKMPKAP